MRMDEISRFSLPTDTIFGLGTTSRLGTETKRLGITRAMVITDAGVRNAGILDEALASLENSGIPFIIFDQTPSDPDTRVIDTTVSLARESGCNGVIAAGGGSALCAGKATASMMTNKGNIRDYAGAGKFVNPPLPCIAIPTAAGSGSEVSKVTIITDEERADKMSIVNFGHAPKVAIVDPMMVRTTLRTQAVASGIDALTHAIEAFYSKQATPLTDGIAVAAIKMIDRNFRPAVLGDDFEAKANMLFASTTANIACGNAGLCLSHAMNHAVNYLIKARGYPPVSYGLIHGICLPISMEFNMPACESKLATLAISLGLGNRGESELELAAKTIARIKELLFALGALRRLPWETIPSTELEEMSQITLGKSQAFDNPRRPTETEMIALFEKTLVGWEPSKAN